MWTFWCDGLGWRIAAGSPRLFVAGSAKREARLPADCLRSGSGVS